MKKLNCLFLIIAFSFSTTVVAGVSSISDDETIERKIAQIKFEQFQAEAMIAKMIQSGRMTDKEGAIAKREIASVKEQDINDVIAEAVEKIKLPNSFATK